MIDIISASSAAGALAFKACGAGGGGCMIIVHRPEDTAEIRKAVESAGGLILEYRIATMPELKTV